MNNGDVEQAESLSNAGGSYIIYKAAREVGALGCHGMEEEWRLLSLRARIACVICQIYIILRERNDWEGEGGGRGGWICQIMTWKKPIWNGREEEKQGSNVEKRASVRLCVCTMARLHHPEGAPLGVWWACDKLSIQGWTVEGWERGRSGSCGDKVPPRRLRRRQEASSGKHRPQKYNNVAAEEHLKVMAGRLATCRGAAEERNWIIYHCSFSGMGWNAGWQMDCEAEKKIYMNAPEGQSQGEPWALFQSFPISYHYATWVHYYQSDFFLSSLTQICQC